MREHGVHVPNVGHIPVSDEALKWALKEHAAGQFHLRHVPLGNIAIEWTKSKQLGHVDGALRIPTGDVTIKGSIGEDPRKIRDTGHVDVVQVATRAMPVHIVQDQFAQVLVVGGNRRDGFSGK